MKTLLAGMTTALGLDLTHLASCWLITRLDGQKFRFTTNSRDVDLDIGDGDGEQTYSAAEGYGRTNIANDSELSVGNLDIGGVFDNQQLDETELRRGLFDFADVKVFFFDWNDTANGIIRILRGTFGEVIVTDQGIFKTTLRDLTTVFSRTLGEKISKDCRDDLGGPFCLVPLFSDLLPVNTALVVGDFYTIPETPDPSDCSQIVLNFEGADAATSGPGFVNDGTHSDPANINAAEIDTAQAPAGGDSTSSLLLVAASSQYVSWADDPALNLGSNPVTISAWIRLNSTGVAQTIASQFGATGDDRSWMLQVNASNQLGFLTSNDGTNSFDINITSTTTLTTGVDYHVAVVRKTDGDWMMFIDGAVEVAATTPTGDPFDGTEQVRVGALEASGSATQFFDGWIDSFELLIGHGRWEGAFTPPTGNLSVAAPTYVWSDFADTIYEVTTAGTTGPCQAIPDTTPGNTHNQGTAVLTARDSWVRAITVDSVGADPRREFTVAELTPNTGHTVGAGPYPATVGFEDDWFNGGVVVWETGANAGLGPKTNMEVRDFVADDGVTITQDIELFTDLPFDIQVGDTGYIIPGCNKDFQTCIDKFNNPRRFKGEPFVPGADTLGQYPDAPAG